ncbi:MAG: ABC transporter ATP-binding protein [Rhodobacteraceae bacterium]|nr:ABC transporter ATP-binding protein [Paracoccaceae bacterium]
MTALLIENVSKSYGPLETVCDVSLHLAAGERLALLGHNGAGKTTLMRMVLGLTPLTSGKIEVLGVAPGSRAARRAIGFLPESVAFHGALTGREQLHHFARLKSVKASVADDFLERVGLTHAMNRKIRTYSKGMRQRIGLAQALLGQPKLAVLDEPTSGLDPISRHEFYDIVDDLAKAGTAVLLSSHALTDLETRTDRIAIMSKGRLLANDSLMSLRKSAGLPIKVQVTATEATADQVAQRLGGQRINGCTITLNVQQEGKVALLGEIASLGNLVKDIDVTPASLEDLYRHYSTADQEGT